MIELKVHDYCHECPMFEADVKTVYSNDAPISHYVRCSRSDECKHIIQYLTTHTTLIDGIRGIYNEEKDK